MPTDRRNEQHGGPDDDDGLSPLHTAKFLFESRRRKIDLCKKLSSADSPLSAANDFRKRLSKETFQGESCLKVRRPTRPEMAGHFVDDLGGQSLG